MLKKEINDEEKFYQTLKSVQIKERQSGNLSYIDETFYNDIYEFLEELNETSIHDSSSKQSQILKEAKIISMEIIQRRERKIIEEAIVNVYKSFNLFDGEKQNELSCPLPKNLILAEKKLYLSLINLLIKYREEFMLDNEVDLELDFPNIKVQINENDKLDDNEPSSEILLAKFDLVKDLISKDEFLNEISKFKQDNMDNPFLIDEEVPNIVVRDIMSAEIKRSLNEKQQNQNNIRIGIADELVKYADLYKQGFLTEEEFNSMKKELL